MYVLVQKLMGKDWVQFKSTIVDNQSDMVLLSAPETQAVSKSATLYCQRDMYSSVHLGPCYTQEYHC